MSKYNLFATKEDWEKLYKEAIKEGIDVKRFKKSQSFDMSSYVLDVLIKEKRKKKK